MTVRLHLRRIRVVKVLRDDEAELVVEVVDAQSVKRCPSCGARTARVHETRSRRVRDLPSLGRPTTLVVQVRRYQCGECGRRFTPEHPELAGKITRRLARTLVADVRKLTIRELARRHRLGWHLIMGIVRAWADTVGAQRRAERCRVLLVDETSLRRGHRYVTVLLNGETGAVLAIVKHRDARALASFFIEQGRRWCRGVEVVVTDGSESYTAAITRHLPRATHILDRFHVVRWFARGLIEVRRHLQRREPPGVTPVFDPEVFRARFLALKRADRLDDAERARLEAIFATRAELARAWAMLQELYGLYAAEDLAGAEEHLDRFARMWETDPLPEFYRVASDIIRWAPEISNFHRVGGRWSNGRLEGTNNLLGLLKRMGFGFVNAANFGARGILLIQGPGP
jgi:transposase